MPPPTQYWSSLVAGHSSQSSYKVYIIHSKCEPVACSSLVRRTFTCSEWILTIIEREWPALEEMSDCSWVPNHYIHSNNYQENHHRVTYSDYERSHFSCHCCPCCICCSLPYTYHKWEDSLYKISWARPYYWLLIIDSICWLLQNHVTDGNRMARAGTKLKQASCGQFSIVAIICSYWSLTFSIKNW